MDKAAERKKDSKSCGDTDIGVHKYGPDNVRAQLPGLWSIAPKEVVGLPPERILTNCYKKDCTTQKVDLMDELLDNGPPLLNVSKPKRVL